MFLFLLKMLSLRKAWLMFSNLFVWWAGFPTKSMQILCFWTGNCWFMYSLWELIHLCIGFMKMCTGICYKMSCFATTVRVIGIFPLCVDLPHNGIHLLINNFSSIWNLNQAMPLHALWIALFSTVHMNSGSKQFGAFCDKVYRPLVLVKRWQWEDDDPWF